MSDANQWRIQIAHKFSEIYHDQPNVVAVAIVGSVSYNMADCYSDLDLRVFWRAVPSQAERKHYRRRAAKMGHYQSEAQTKDNLSDEVFFFGGDADSGFQIDIKNGFAEPVEKALQDPNTERHIGVFQVIKNAVPVAGEETFQAWQSQIAPYPASLIQKRVQSHLRVGPWWLWEEFAVEGEPILATRAFRRTLERLMVALAWLNQSCIRHAEYAKHTAQSLNRMKWKPQNCWPRFQHVLQSDLKPGLSELRKLVEETYDLVQTHLPEIDIDKLKEETFGTKPSIVLRSKKDIAGAETNASPILAQLDKVYASNPNVKSIIISGNVSYRSANYSAIETTIFWAKLPTDQDRKNLVEQWGGIQQKDFGYHDVQSVLRERILIQNTAIDMRHITCETFDTLLDDVLHKCDPTQSKQNAIAQMRHGFILYGKEWLHPRITRSDKYPNELRRQTIQNCLDEISWWHEQIAVFSERDALVYYPILTFQAQKIYQILMALNKMYLVENWSTTDAFYETHTGWDRINPVLENLKIAPPDFKSRFNTMFHLPPKDGAKRLHELLTETLTLVKETEPQIKIEQKEMKHRKAWHNPPHIS